MKDKILYASVIVFAAAVLLLTPSAYSGQLALGSISILYHEISL